MLYRVCDGMHLVLGSGSPRRREMLSRVGLNFSMIPAQVDEELITGEDALQAALRLATAKVRAARREYPKAALLAADTLVAVEGRVLGKPEGEDQARKMLSFLSGRWHQVITGFCLGLGEDEEQGQAVSRVLFRRLSPEEIEAYLRTGEPLDKAGAYGVQGIGAALVEAVEGSYTNVVGLPLAAVIELLLGRQVIEPRPD